MHSSQSEGSEGIVFDTNVLSIFSKGDQTNLLFQTFAYSYETNQLYISPAIKQELEDGAQRGIAHLIEVLKLIEQGHIQIINPTELDRQFMKNLPPKLDIGEAEAIAICHRLEYIFISHDRKAINYCEREGISYINLSVLFERLKQMQLLTESDIKQMLGP